MITDETPERLLHLIRLGHPDETGEPYGRFEVMDEISRRKDILKDLGWPLEMNAIYKNLFTGEEITLKDLIEDKKGYQLDIEEDSTPQAWDLMEHWNPKETWTDEFLMKEFKQKPTLFNWIGDKK